MITGDNILTAANVSTQLSMGPDGTSILSWPQPEDDPALENPTGDSVKFDLSSVKGELLKTVTALELIDDEYKTTTLCIDGKTFKRIRHPLPHELSEKITSRIKVFARTSPAQKEIIIELLKKSGNKVLMCGDGTNDVGGLKKASVGVAIVGIRDPLTKEEEEAEKKRRADKIRVGKEKALETMKARWEGRKPELEQLNEQMSMCKIQHRSNMPVSPLDLYSDGGWNGRTTASEIRRCLHSGSVHLQGQQFNQVCTGYPEARCLRPSHHDQHLQSSGALEHNPGLLTGNSQLREPKVQ